MRKLACYCTADQCLWFCYINSTIILLPKSEIFKSLTIFCGCTARFVSDLVGNIKDRISHDVAQLLRFFKSHAHLLVHNFYNMVHTFISVCSKLRSLSSSRLGETLIRRLRVGESGAIVFPSNRSPIELSLDRGRLGSSA